MSREPKEVRELRADGFRLLAEVTMDHLERYMRARLHGDGPTAKRRPWKMKGYPFVVLGELLIVERGRGRNRLHYRLHSFVTLNQDEPVPYWPTSPDDGGGAG